MPTQPQRSSKTIWSSGFECGDHFIRIYWRIMSGVCLLFQMLSITLVIHWQLFFLRGTKMARKEANKNVRMATSV